MVFKPVCRDASEINHFLLLISFGESLFIPPALQDQLFMATGSGIFQPINQFLIFKKALA